jgi:hypothetical protein
MSPEGRRFYDHMRRAADLTRTIKRDSNFHMEAFSFNASNRDGHNSTTGERRRK